MQEKWLSMVNKEKVEKYMHEVLSSNEMPEHLPDFFWEDWAKAKDSNPKFRELFKDSLKIKQRINFDLPISQRSNEPEYQRMESFYHLLTKKIRHFFTTDEYSDKNPFGDVAFFSLEEISKTPGKELYMTYWNQFCIVLDSCLRYITYGDNKIESSIAGKYKAFQIKRRKDSSLYARNVEYAEKDNEIFSFSLREGERANKAFRRLARLIKLPQDIMDLFEQLETARSMLIQTSKMDATLVLSIDPEDFMTASDNSLNWDSCFSLTNNGCYKTGTYSAMITPNLAIAYIESEKPYQPIGKDPKYSFSNKIWRAWVYIDENIFFVNKNYPFNSDTITSFLYNWLISTSSDIYVNSKDANLELYVSESFMYDDTNSDSLFYIKNEVIHNFLAFYEIELSLSPRCLFCGAYLEDNSNDGMFCCLDCDDTLFCSECGDPILREDAYWVDDMPYCPCCYEQEIEYKEEQKRMEREIYGNWD